MSVSMRSLRIVGTTFLVICVAQMITRTPSYANGGAREHGRTVTVESSGGSQHHGSSSLAETEPTELPLVYCSYTAAPLRLVAGFIGGLTPGVWWIVTCFGDHLNAKNDTAIVWLADTAGTHANGQAPFAIAQTAVSFMTLPLPIIRTNPDTSTFVNLQTWFWIDPSAWHTQSATARSGGSFATAIATPIQVTFSAGNGTSFVCRGGGTPYSPSAPTSGSSTRCSYTYPTSSAGQSTPDGDTNDAAFQVTASITWSISWTFDSTMTGSLPPITTSASSRLRVEQVESVGNT